MTQKIILFVMFVSLFSTPLWADQSRPKQEKSTDQHSTIYTKKIKTLVKAINIGQFKTEEDYQNMLTVACERNQCSSGEREAIKIIGQEFVQCRLTHLKSHGVFNSDAINICDSKQAIFACDSLQTPLLRKMCYHSNKYSIQVLKEKESKIQKRQPASF